MIRVEFCLVMPERDSRNPQGFRNGRNHLLVRAVEDDLAKKLAGQSWLHVWADDRRAEVHARLLAEDETLRPSHGFWGYDWMVDSILQYGEICVPHERPEERP